MVGKSERRNPCGGLPSALALGPVPPQEGAMPLFIYCYYNTILETRRLIKSRGLFLSCLWRLEIQQHDPSTCSTSSHGGEYYMERHSKQVRELTFITEQLPLRPTNLLIH